MAWDRFLSVDSTNIVSIYYDTKAAKMRVNFKAVDKASGMQAYEYKEPLSVFGLLAGAESVGSTFASLKLKGKKL